MRGNVNFYYHVMKLLKIHKHLSCIFNDQTNGCQEEFIPLQILWHAHHHQQQIIIISDQVIIDASLEKKSCRKKAQLICKTQNKCQL